MDRCVLLTSTPECVVSPQARQHMIITWCRQFPSLSTNILLIKSKLKLESRAIAVRAVMSPRNPGAVMSPRNPGGKYRCCPHTRSRKWTCQFVVVVYLFVCFFVFFFVFVFVFVFVFFGGGQSVWMELHHCGAIAWRQCSQSCGVFKSWISVPHCPVQRKWRVLHNYDISMLEQVCVSFNGIAYLMKVNFCLTHWGRVTHICVSKLTIIGSDNGLSPGHCLWITVDNLWHWNETGKASDWCQLYYSGKY